jgi:NAD/NADP transhydrogenase alpha subunit
LIELLTPSSAAQKSLNINFDDDILAATIVTYQGQIRWKPQT